MRSLFVKLATLMAVGMCAKGKSNPKTNVDENNTEGTNAATENNSTGDGTNEKPNSAYSIPTVMFTAILLITGIAM